MKQSNGGQTAMDMENLFNYETYWSWKHCSWNLIHLCWSYIRNHADRNWQISIKEKEAH